MTLAHLLPPGEGKGGALGLHRDVVDLRHIEFNAGGTAGSEGLRGGLAGEEGGSRFQRLGVFITSSSRPSRHPLAL